MINTPYLKIGFDHQASSLCMELVRLDPMSVNTEEVITEGVIAEEPAPVYTTEEFTTLQGPVTTGVVSTEEPVLEATTEEAANESESINSEVGAETISIIIPLSSETTVSSQQCSELSPFMRTLVLTSFNYCNNRRTLLDVLSMDWNGVIINRLHALGLIDASMLVKVKRDFCPFHLNMHLMTRLGRFVFDRYGTNEIPRWWISPVASHFKFDLTPSSDWDFLRKMASNGDWTQLSHTLSMLCIAEPKGHAAYACDTELGNARSQECYALMQQYAKAYKQSVGKYEEVVHALWMAIGNKWFSIAVVCLQTLQSLSETKSIYDDLKGVVKDKTIDYGPYLELDDLIRYHIAKKEGTLRELPIQSWGRLLEKTACHGELVHLFMDMWEAFSIANVAGFDQRFKNQLFDKTVRFGNKKGAFYIFAKSQPKVIFAKQWTIPLVINDKYTLKPIQTQALVRIPTTVRMRQRIAAKMRYTMDLLHMLATHMFQPKCSWMPAHLQDMFNAAYQIIFVESKAAAIWQKVVNTPHFLDQVFSFLPSDGLFSLRKEACNGLFLGMVEAHTLKVSTTIDVDGEAFHVNANETSAIQSHPSFQEAHKALLWKHVAQSLSSSQQ